MPINRIEVNLMPSPLGEGQTIPPKNRHNLGEVEAPPNPLITARRNQMYVLLGITIDSGLLTVFFHYGIYEQKDWYNKGY